MKIALFLFLVAFGYFNLGQLLAAKGWIWTERLQRLWKRHQLYTHMPDPFTLARHPVRQVAGEHVCCGYPWDHPIHRVEPHHNI